MSERIPNKKHNFHGIDPQESLIKSLESIKSLLKQGDSKINEARENIARADNIGNDTLQTRLSNQNLEIPDTVLASTDSIQDALVLDKPAELDILEVNDDSAEIMTLDDIIEEAGSEHNIVNTIATKVASATVKSTAQADPTPLKELYDHNLIVPMLDEIILPDDENSSLFNMDSKIDIKADSKLESALLKIDQAVELSKTDVFPKHEPTKSAYNTIKKPGVNPKADIISFELNSNVKKTNKKIEHHNADSISTKTTKPKIQKNISLVEDSIIENQQPADQTTTKNQANIDQVVIKETTITKADKKSATSSNNKLTNGKVNTTKKIAQPKVSLAEVDLTPAIDSAIHTDDVLNSISKTDLDVSSNKPSVKKPNQKADEEINFSEIEGLDRLKFNAQKMGALQKRIEKRVHNRLIQLIVQLDDEVKNIFTDEIKNCIAHEKNNNKDNK